jgi:type I restriction enzyme M protein
MRRLWFDRPGDRLSSFVKIITLPLTEYYWIEAFIMITKDSFPQLLESLGFTKRKSIYSKTVGAATLLVDAAKQEIIYPESQGLIVNERPTCNFSANENFVVFECVHRLLEKGYKPEHIELEPKWKLGHGASGGRADILIKDNLNKPLLIIECKTPGNEFKKAWNKTLQDGNQLFSYAQADQRNAISVSLYVGF